MIDLITAISMGITLSCLILSAMGLYLAIKAIIKITAMEKSTHTVQMVPAQDLLKTPDDDKDIQGPYDYTQFDMPYNEQEAAKYRQDKAMKAAQTADEVYEPL